MSKKLTTKEFIERAIQIHGDKYDYSQIVYNGMFNKIKVICPKHGIFEITAHNFICGKGCKKCFIENNSNSKRKSVEQFIQEAIQIHGDKYNYSKVEYKNTDTKVCIICPNHGEFWQTPKKHLLGYGCPYCKKKTKKIVQPSMKNKNELFIEKAKQIHGDKYYYSKVEYKNNSTKVCIICPIHGEFWQTPHKHLLGQGCKLCNFTVYNTESFIKEARKKHGDKYDYSKVEYIDAKTKVCIICPIHGEFWQTPSNHLHKTRLEGCPKCRTSKLEDKIIKLLNENKIEYQYNKHYSFLNNLQLDFFLPKYNIAIECQGQQHFEPFVCFGGEEKYQKTIKYDKIKYELCKQHGIKLLYFANKQYEYWGIIYTNVKDLLKQIF